MMYIRTRRREMKSPFSSFWSNSFLFFSLHFPLNLNCQTKWKRKEPNHLEDLNSGASSSSTPLHGGHFKGGDKQQKGNDFEVLLSAPQVINDSLLYSSPLFPALVAPFSSDDLCESFFFFFKVAPN